MDSRPEFDFDNFRRVLESIEESKEELRCFEEPHSTPNMQRTPLQDFSFVHSNGSPEHVDLSRDLEGHGEQGEREDDCICGPNCSLKRLTKVEDLLEEEDLVDSIIKLYPEEEKLEDFESESKAQASLEFPRWSGRHYFRCTLNSPSKRLFTIEEINSSISEVIDETQKYSFSSYAFSRRMDGSEI